MNGVRKKYRFLIRFLVKFSILGIVFLFLVTFVCGFLRMHGNAMFPAIRDGDFCLYAKTGAITQNDVIFYRDNFGQISCGRVVAQGGQTITFGETGGYMIDGYVFSDQNPYPTYGGSERETTVPDGCFYVLHDLREDTGDSRTQGVVSKEQIVGKLVFLFRRRGF